MIAEARPRRPSPGAESVYCQCAVPPARCSLPGMAIETPSSTDEHVLAALIYAESTVVHGTEPSEEMLAIGWTARNRYLHVQNHASDRKWWGNGSDMESIAKGNGGREFVSVSGPRYTTFRNHLGEITNSLEVAFGNLAVKAAKAVLAAPAPKVPGVFGTYPYVWFQRGSTSPSKRACATPTSLGSHYFWSFAPGGEKG